MLDNQLVNDIDLALPLNNCLHDMSEFKGRRILQVSKISHLNAFYLLTTRPRKLTVAKQLVVGAIPSDLIIFV